MTPIADTAVTNPISTSTDTGTGTNTAIGTSTTGVNDTENKERDL